MSRIPRLALALILAGFCGCERANPPAPAVADDSANDREMVERDVRELFDALHRQGDVDTLLRLAHPKLLQAAGGEAEARRAFQVWIDDIRTDRIKVESFGLRDLPEFVESPYTEFVIVPTRAVLQLPDGRRIDSRSFQLGARLKGTADWRYVDGSRLDRDLLASLFPDFPRNVALPAQSTDDL